LSSGTIAFLRHHPGDAVRDIALQLLRRRAPDWCAMDLLAANYGPGDHRWLRELLDRTRSDGDRYRAIRFLDHLATEVGPADLAGCMRWAGEHAPSSELRGRVVKWLVRRRLAPGPLLTECLHDCEEETRRRARAALRRIAPAER
jgi:hypothetical protein